MKKILAALAAGTVLSATPALAQDARATFTGPRVEVIAGWDASRSGSSVDDETARDLDQSVNGLLYGGGIGFDFAADENFVVGVEAEMTDSTAKTDTDTIPNTFNLGRVETGRDIYVGGRAGFIVGEKTLIYAKGGYTNARYNLVGTDGTVNLNQRIDTDGWRIGGGVEMAVSENAFAKIEYRYSKYGEAEFDFNGGTPDSSRFRIDTDRHQVVASVGVRF